MFNNGTYQARVKSGELLERIVKERHPAAPKANVPYCTKSQMVMYVDREGNEVATVHRYLQTNLTVGASGQPDPKRLLVNGVLYVAWWEPRGDDR